jgi:AhpD family alkylhydroperoxidase
MPIGRFVEYEDASDEVRVVYDDIMATRGVDWINNFWKALANDPAQLLRIWENIKQVMAPGALDPLLKEMVYVAVSATNGCEYCINSHIAGARAKGMTDHMLAELMAVVGMANETNALVTGWQVELDDRLRDAARGGV